MDTVSDSVKIVNVVKSVLMKRYNLVTLGVSTQKPQLGSQGGGAEPRRFVYAKQLF